jgi:uncharacterized Fe-S cluster protein YjdI
MKRYAGRDIEVTYDPVRRLHAAECVRGLPSVFDRSRRPWVQPDGAEAQVLACVIERCPIGALHPANREDPRISGDLLNSESG